MLALLVLLFGLAPAINAACSLDALGAHVSGVGSDTPNAPDTPVPGDDLCCAHDLDAFVVKAKATTADGAWALVPSGVLVVPSSRSLLAPGVGQAGGWMGLLCCAQPLQEGRWHSLPDPEPGDHLWEPAAR